MVCHSTAPRGRKRKLPPCTRTPSPPFRESSVVKAHEKLSPSQQVTPVASFAPIHMRSVSLLGSALGRWTRTLLVLEGLVHSLSLSLSRHVLVRYRQCIVLCSIKGAGNGTQERSSFRPTVCPATKSPKAFPTTKCVPREI